MTALLLPTTANLSHLSDDPIYKEEIPYEIWANNVPEGAQRTNVKLNIVSDCELTDIRTLDDNSRPELETWGFQWFHQEFPFETGLSSVDDVGTSTAEQRAALDEYLAKMSDFLRERLGCEKVLCWDWRVRSLIRLMSQLHYIRTNTDSFSYF